AGRYSPLSGETCNSRRQPRDLPSAALQPQILETVVETVFSPLPELEYVRLHPATAPDTWQRTFDVAELIAHLRELRLQGLARIDPAALPRRPGRQLAVAGPADEIAEHVGRAEPPGYTADDDLAIHRIPGKMQADPGIGGNMPGLAAAQVGIEHQAALVDMLEQHQPLPGPAFAIHRGHTHGRGVDHGTGHHRLLEPVAELIDRAIAQGFPGQTAVAVFPAQVFEAHGGSPVVSGDKAVLSGN